MRFPPVEDISDLDTKRININKLDHEMMELIVNVRFAVTHDRQFGKKSIEMPSLLDDLMRQFMFTHQSLRLMLKEAYRKKKWVIIADTASLVREQIEKIFVVVTILKDPKHWIRQYLRNAWQKDYERYLLELDEYGKITRYDEHLKKGYPTFLENGRRPRTRLRTNYPVIVSEFAKRCVRFNYYNYDAPKPNWFKRPKGNLRGYLNGYFYFPSPWDSVKLVKDEPAYYAFLDRWYREYKFYSAYSHILMEKLILQHFSQYKSVVAAEKLEIYGRKRAEQFILTSNTAAATLCALIVPQLSNTHGTKAQTKEYWALLYNFGLLPKALWELYPKDILG